MMHKSWVGALGAGICVLAFGQAQAMTKSNIHAQNLGHVAPAALAGHLQLQAGNQLVPANAVRLRNGHKLTRVRQVYKGVPVYGRSVVVERGPGGDVLSVDGALERDLGRELASVTPRLTPVQARVALQRAHGQLRQTVRNSEARLYVYARGKQPARLIYRVSYLVGAGNDIARPTALVDAATGDVIKQWNGLTTNRQTPTEKGGKGGGNGGGNGGGGGGSGSTTLVQATGPGGNGYTGLYHYDNSAPGREYLSVSLGGSTCYMENDDVATYDLGGGRHAKLWTFDCTGTTPMTRVSSGDAINGAFSPINDAHHFGQVVHNMYVDWFGEPPLKNADGTPMQLHMWVHYGHNYGNAFWDGSEMVFGDGAQYFYPLVVMDVTGHEISHGFTEQHSGLEYTAQSGGINEAFSDMAGEATEYFNEGGNDFLVGAEILKPGTADLLGLPALRDMCQPSRDGSSIDNAADYYDGLDVHYSSGVYNKAFCVLAKSGGWSTRMAFEVFHDANALYWGPQETYDSAACGVEQAASDRGYAVADVTSAFQQVGVTCSSP